MALGEFSDVFWLDFDNASLVNRSIRYQFFLDQFPQPCRRVFVVFVVVSTHSAASYPLKARRGKQDCALFRGFSRYRPKVLHLHLPADRFSADDGEVHGGSDGFNSFAHIGVRRSLDLSCSYGYGAPVGDLRVAGGLGDGDYGAVGGGPERCS